MKIYSPSNIEVLLHCHVSPEPHPRLDAGAVRDAIEVFRQEGCIEPVEGTENVFRTTPRGKAWVQALCNVSIPKVVFLDDHDQVIDWR